VTRVRSSGTLFDNRSRGLATDYLINLLIFLFVVVTVHVGILTAQARALTSQLTSSYPCTFVPYHYLPLFHVRSCTIKIVTKMLCQPIRSRGQHLRQHFSASQIVQLPTCFSIFSCTRAPRCHRSTNYLLCVVHPAVRLVM
jgi:hypothetical protein